MEEAFLCYHTEGEVAEVDKGCLETGLKGKFLLVPTGNPILADNTSLVVLVDTVEDMIFYFHQRAASKT